MWWPGFVTVFLQLCSLTTAYPHSVNLQSRSALAKACGPRPIIDCEQFSAYGNSPAEHLCCREYVRGSYPRTIGGSRVDLYRYTQGGWDPNNQTTIGHLESLGDALEKVLPLYESFGDTFNLIVVFSKPPLEDEGTAVDGYEQETPGTTSRCYVRIEDADDLTIEQTIVHEVYHCVEDSNRNGNAPPADDFNSWYIEGVAEFYAADYYPFHQDNTWIRKYNPSIPLYKQSYEVSLFFVFAHGYGWSYDDINDLVFNEPQAKSFADCLSSLSGNADIGKTFPAFAQAFSNNLITYSDGSLVDPETSPGPLKFQSLPIPDGGSTPWPVKAPTFTVDEFSLSLDPGQSFSITWNPTSKQTSMFYRQVPATDWIDMTTDAASFALTCDDDAAVIDFLFTCTDDTDQGSGTLEFTQINKQDCCTADPTAPSCTTPPASIVTPAPPATNPSSGGGIDSCLRGTWNLNLADLQAAIEKAEAKSSATISNLQVTGSTQFVVPSSGTQATWTFTDLDISYDIAADSFTGSTIIDINGNSVGDLVMGTGSTFTITNPVSSGIAKTTTTTDITGPIEIDFDLSSEYGSNILCAYTCSSTTLSLSGTIITASQGLPAGTLVWSYGFTKA